VGLTVARPFRAGYDGGPFLTQAVGLGWDRTPLWGSQHIQARGIHVGRLKGKIAIVTGGGGSGIGHGISLELARDGAQVVIVELDLTAAESVKGQIEREGGGASVLRGDVSDANEVRAFTEQVVRDHRRLDILVNSAGVGLIRPVAGVSEEEYDRLMGIDLRGVWLCSKYAIPQMQQQKEGVIINISSVHARATMPLYGLYGAMKSGVAGLTRGIAVQYGPDGIRANTVSPGLVDGKQTRDVIGQFASNVEEWLDNFVRRDQALPRLIRPEDIGRTVAFLVSDDARSITGADLPVDAGTWAQLTSRV
jgi:NAD(P)-dependent dehydrogenase (short-subunit alcohol dehydrogenase family)